MKFESSSLLDIKIPKNVMRFKFALEKEPLSGLNGTWLSDNAPEKLPFEKVKKISGKMWYDYWLEMPHLFCVRVLSALTVSCSRIHRFSGVRGSSRTILSMTMSGRFSCLCQTSLIACAHENRGAKWKLPVWSCCPTSFSMDACTIGIRWPWNSCRSVLRPGIQDFRVWPRAAQTVYSYGYRVMCVGSEIWWSQTRSFQGYRYGEHEMCTANFLKHIMIH